MNNRFLYRISSAAVSLALAASMTVTAGAWSENPGESEETTAVTSASETTTAPQLGGDIWETEESTTTETEEPDAVLEDDLVADEEDEDIGEEIVEPEETEAPETQAPETQAPETAAPETTAAATTTAAAPSNTAAPDSYQAVEPFKMYVPEVLNVRGGPGTEYDKLGQVYANNTISIYGVSGDWYVFDYYGLDGYLLSSLLTEVSEDTQTTTTTQAPETDTTQPPVDDGSGNDDQEDDATIDDDGGYIEEVTTPEETDAPETPAQTTTTKETPDVAAPVEGDSDDTSGFPPVLLALICAVAAFVLIGVVPVLVHRSYHKKLYQY